TSATDSIIDPSVINSALNSGGTVLINANGNTAISAGNILINADLSLSDNNKTSTLIFSAGTSSGSITLGSNHTIGTSGNSNVLTIDFIAGATGSIVMGSGSELIVNPPQQAANPSMINATFTSSGGTGVPVFLGNASAIITDSGNVMFGGPVYLGSAGQSGTVTIDTTNFKHNTSGGTVAFGSTVHPVSRA